VQKLAQDVRDNKLAPLDRLGILSDAFEAAKAGYGDTVSALTLLEAYQHEANDAVWDVMASNFGSIRLVMDDDQLREAMKPYGRKLVAEQLARLGMSPKETDSHFDHLLRPTILGIASISEEKQVVDTMLDWFNTMQTSEDVTPDLRGVTYTTAARHGDAKTFEKLVHLHNTSSSPEERVTLAAAITAFEQPELVQKALDTATWQWIQQHWQWLKDNLGADTSFTRMPVYVARVMGRSDFLPEYKQFFESVMEPSIDRAYKQGIEMIDWQSAWRDRDLQAIQKYFA
jgi:hypothetical protein